MTTAEAIKVIKDMIEIEWRRQFPPDLATDYIEALELAVEALRKQEPMKPTYDHRYAELGCSVCGSMVSGWEESPDFCPNCGQAIDWRDE